MAENLTNLLQGIVDRDEDAMQELYLQMSGEVFAIAYVRLHDADAAEDVRQETFYRIWNKAGSFMGNGSSESSAHAWILSIARNLTTDIHRRKSWETPRADLTELRKPNTLFDTDALCSNLDLRSLIESLPRKLRDPIVLRILADLPLEEVAEQLRISISTVKRRCTSGLLALREQINQGPDSRASTKLKKGE